MRERERMNLPNDKGENYNIKNSSSIALQKPYFLILNKFMFMFSVSILETYSKS